MSKPQYAVNSYSCPRCDRDTEDNAALVHDGKAVVWCACGLVILVDGDYVETIHDFADEA